MVKKNILILCLIVAIPISLICFTKTSSCLTSKYYSFLGNDDSVVSENTYKKLQFTLAKVLDIINNQHFFPKKIDDSFSKYIIKQMLKATDPDKSVYLKGQVQYLKTKYTNVLDNQLNNGNLSFLVELDSIYRTNIKVVKTYFPSIINKNFDFYNNNGYYYLNPDSINYVATNQQRKKRWIEQLKYLVLNRYANAIKRQNNKKQDSGFVIKSDSLIQAEARTRVKKNIDRLLVRMSEKISFSDKFNILLGLTTNYMDPHSEYLPPRDKQYFDEQMKKSFYGIGAVLNQNENGIKVVRLTTGGPAWKSKQIKPGDYITGVGEGKNGRMEDIFGLNINEAVQLIRGQKDSVVRLEIKTDKGQKSIVSITREEIKQEDAVIKSSIIKKGEKKMGYIYVPEFYSRFGYEDGANCSEDFKKALIQLKQKNVEGIIVDLRNNGGGSLYEVIQMVGMLIAKGPVVQILTKEGYGNKYDDRHPDVIYDGPVAVMVNEFSASASEIFAAAIQDYHRGIIVGSTSTFGKGTVQKPIEILSSKEEWSNYEKQNLGAVKITVQKFYRINGGSTQNKGVESDILLPSRYKYNDYLEKNNPYSLSWDQTNKLNFNYWYGDLPIKQLKILSSKRVQNSTAFKAIDSLTEWINHHSLVKRSLNYESFLAEKEIFQAKLKQYDSLSNLIIDTSYHTYLANESVEGLQDTSVVARNKEWAKNIYKDVYIQETFNILNDYIHSKQYSVWRKNQGIVEEY